jgi:hypothetical protein
MRTPVRGVVALNRADESRLAAGDVVFTSRALVTGDTRPQPCDRPACFRGAGGTGAGIESRPRYLIAKGGITSSDLVTRAYEARDGAGPGLARGAGLELGPNNSTGCLTSYSWQRWRKRFAKELVEN